MVRMWRHLAPWKAMNFIKKKIKKGHKKGHDYDFDDIDPSAPSTEASSKPKDTEEWQFFEQLTQRVQATVQKTQTTLTKLKDNSAIEDINKLEDFVEPEETNHISPPPNSLSWANFDDEGGFQPPVRPPPPKRPPAPEQEPTPLPPPEVSQEQPPIPDLGFDLLEEFGFQKKESPVVPPPPQGLLIVDEPIDVEEEEGPDPFDTSFVDFDKPIAAAAAPPARPPPPTKPPTAIQDILFATDPEETQEDEIDPFDTSYVDTRLSLSTSTHFGDSKADSNLITISGATFSEFKDSQDDLIVKPSQEGIAFVNATPKPYPGLNPDSTGDFSDRSSTFQPSEGNFDPFDTSFTDTSGTLNQKLSNLEKDNVFQKNYLLDDHEVQYETLNTFSIENSTLSANNFGAKPPFYQPLEPDIGKDLQYLNIKPQSPIQESEDTFNEISELTDSIPEYNLKDRFPSDTHTFEDSPNFDNTFEASDLKCLTTSEKADSHQYLDSSFADTTITDNVTETSTRSETPTLEGFRVLDDVLESSSTQDFEDLPGKSSSLEAKPIPNLEEEDRAIPEGAPAGSAKQDFDPFGDKFEDSFSFPQGECDPFGDHLSAKANPNFDQQIDFFEDSFGAENIPAAESIFSPEQETVIEVTRRFQELEFDSASHHSSNKSTPLKSPDNLSVKPSFRRYSTGGVCPRQPSIKRDMSNPFLSDFEEPPTQVVTSPFFEDPQPPQGTPKRRMSTNPFETDDEEEDIPAYLPSANNVFSTNGTATNSIFFTDPTSPPDKHSFFDTIISGTEELTKNVTQDFFSMPPKAPSGEFVPKSEEGTTVGPFESMPEPTEMEGTIMPDSPSDGGKEPPKDLFGTEDEDEEEEEEEVSRPPMSPPNQMSIKGIDNLGFQDRNTDSGDFSELDDFFGGDHTGNKSEPSRDELFSPEKKPPTEPVRIVNDPFDDIFGASKPSEPSNASIQKNGIKENLFDLENTSPTDNPFESFQDSKDAAKLPSPPKNIIDPFSFESPTESKNEEVSQMKAIDPFSFNSTTQETKVPPLDPFNFESSQDKNNAPSSKLDLDPFDFEASNEPQSKEIPPSRSIDPFEDFLGGKTNSSQPMLDQKRHLETLMIWEELPKTQNHQYQWEIHLIPPISLLNQSRVRFQPRTPQRSKPLRRNSEKAIEKLESEPVGEISVTGPDLFDPFAMPGNAMKASESLNEGFGGMDNFDPFAPSPTAPPTTKRPKKLQPKKEESQDSFDDDDGPDFSVVIRPKMKTDSLAADSLGPPPLLPPPPKTPTKGVAYSGDVNLNPFQAEDSEDSFSGDLPQLANTTVEPPKAQEPPPLTKTDSQESPSTPLFDEDTSQPLEEFPTPFQGDGWDMMIRLPNKKKITGNRYWKKVYVRLTSNNILHLFNKPDDNQPFQEMPLQACYSLSDMAAQQFDNYGKIFTVKLLYVVYRERVGVRPGQISRVMQGQIATMGQIAKLGLPLEHAPQVSQLLKLGTQVYADIRSFIQVVEDALFSLPLKRDRGPTYKTEEIQVTVYDEFYVEQDRTGHVGRQLARVRIFFLAFLSNMPEVEVGINDLTRQGKEVVGRYDILPVVTEEWIRLEDVHFHSCVKMDDFEASRSIKFQPPDACLFELLRFRIRPPKRRELPLQLKASMVVVDTRVEIRADVLVPGYSSRKQGQVPCEDIMIRFPIPECWIYLFRVEKHFRYGSFKSASRKPGKIKGLERIMGTAQSLEPSMIEVSTGQAKYEHHHHAVVWRIPRLPKEGQGAYTEHLFILRLELTSFDQIPDSFERYIHVEFNMPNSTVSHTTVRSISVNSGTAPEKFVRYVARHHYRVELEMSPGGIKPAPVITTTTEETPEEEADSD
ncbi:stnB [Cordylochernes scorpioides]|uniref:StnB n=1 Tax=Cordylochernes scorpioides TaxID=51811 RepID=A0ABY6L491_9ARAC|nr:stnB [Cordylochernes scorpioides]